MKMNKRNSTIRKKVQTKIKPLLSSVNRGVVISILRPITILPLLLAIMTNIGFALSLSVILTFGTCGSGDGQFMSPNGVAVDSSGNIYVADTGNARIQKFDSNGNFILKFGTVGSDIGQFAFPFGVAVDSTGNIYAADSGNDRIQKFDSNTNFIFKFGTNGSGDGQFAFPGDIAVDSSGNIYVADTGNSRIQKFDSNGNFILKFGTFGSGNRQFMSPNGVAVDSSGNIYVADSGEDTDNHRIQKFDSNGNFILKFGTFGSDIGQFSFPRDVAVDSSGNIYVADSTNHRIQVIAQVLDGGDGGGVGGGCSVASVGSASSIPLFLLIPVFIILRRGWRIYISRK